jgi:hypothetical protein
MKKQDLYVGQIYRFLQYPQLDMKIQEICEKFFVVGTEHFRYELEYVNGIQNNLADKHFPK